MRRTDRAAAAGWIHAAPAQQGLERVEAFFAGAAFEPHRHDTYAIGFTLQGVQSFRYRGVAENCVPGQVFVLHPDELHDGRAGTATGFRYRILYIEPAAIHAALEQAGREERSRGKACRPLPFLRAPVSDDRRLAWAILPALEDLDLALDELRRDQIILDLAEALAAVDPSAVRGPLAARHWRAAAVARDFLEANLDRTVASAELEAASGLSRFALARHFRACFGTSPYRYLVLRRLDRARGLIRTGTPLAEAALASGFADQSHFTRQFKKAYGLSPGRWTTMIDKATVPPVNPTASQAANFD